MPPTSLSEIIAVLRDAVGPVILISGVGMLLLVLTNRLGRAIDRARKLAHDLPGQTGHERTRTLAEVAIIYRRARIIRLAILFAVTSALLAAVLVVLIFIAAWLQWQQGWMLGVIFVGCLLALCASLVAFMGDINLSLHALNLELPADVLRQADQAAKATEK